MAMPYKVIVRVENKTGIHVDIKPMPIASKKEFIPVVVMTVQRILTRVHMNTFQGRAKLKKELEDAIQELHNQGIVVPKPEENTVVVPVIK